MAKVRTHHEVGMMGIIVPGPKATAFLSVHDDGDGLIGLDSYFWSKSNQPPKSVDDMYVYNRMDDADIEGGFFWDLSPEGWEGHSKMVSEIIGRKVTLEEGDGKTDWRENNRRGHAELRSAGME